MSKRPTPADRSSVLDAPQVSRAPDGSPALQVSQTPDMPPARESLQELNGSLAPDAALALYVHMPWCVRKCPYCDFNSHQLKSAEPDSSYIDALIRDFDFELPRLAGRRIDTVFFGGGTPSLFQPEDFSRLLGTLRQRIEFAENVEITMEANPGTIERGRFAGYRDAGINRVSLGAQTFVPRALQELGRIHSADDTHRAVQELRAANIHNFNLDLMYALPQQTFEEAVSDVRTACRLNPSHISYYQLTLEPGTVFHSRPPPLPDEDAAWKIQSECQRLLAEAGYAQYEISAYARKGARCRHNLNYWLFGDYVGIGAGAHGKLTLGLPGRILRTTKPKQPREYQEQVRRANVASAAEVAQTGERRSAAPAAMDPQGVKLKAEAQEAIKLGARGRDAREREATDAAEVVGGGVIGEITFIAEADLPFEFMLNALRLNQGFSVQDFERGTGLGLGSVEAKLQQAQTRGLLETWAGGWRPTELGRRFLNDLQASFLA